MKTLGIHTAEMTLQPFFGRLTNQTTRNLTSAVLAPTMTLKEVVMKKQTMEKHCASLGRERACDNPIGVSCSSSISVHDATTLPFALGVALMIILFVSLGFAQQSNIRESSNANSDLSQDLDGPASIPTFVSQPTQRPIGPPPKEEEIQGPNGPKEESDGNASIQNQYAPSGGGYDVGVIPETEHCPPGSELIVIYMDDEDTKNADKIVGWTGAITQSGGKNTRFVFCRVDGTKFSNFYNVASPSPFAVLSLAAKCPPGLARFQRTFENECHDNRNASSGNIWPNQVSSWRDCYDDVGNYSSTQLNFCLLPPSVGYVAPSLPDLNMTYGVFAASSFKGALATGSLHSDDEDDDNHNSYDSNYGLLGTWASSIISGEKNTDISVVKAKIGPPPMHCSEKVPYYDGTLLTATWDGANCYIKPVPSGATPFIYQDGYYINANKSTQCLAGTWDGANCYFMPKPSDGFLWHDAFYVKPGPGHSCWIGQFDGANCLVKSAPWGTHAFEWQSKWYFTTLYTCKDGAYDGANCYVMKAPGGKFPFIYKKGFYYAD